MTIKAAILTTSDTRTLEEDFSGHRIRELLEGLGAEIVGHKVVRDDLKLVRDQLLEFAGMAEVNLILTTGGTGLGPRDNTPEATLEVVDREAPGIAQAMRRETASKTPFAMLSRGVAGIRNGTLIINLPGSLSGVEECFEVISPILPHAVRVVAGDTRH